MPSRDDVDPPGVHFVVDPVESGPDEDLPQPGRGPRVRSRVLLVVLAVAVLLAALIVRGVTGHHPEPVAARTSAAPSTPTPSSSRIPVIVRDEPTHGPRRCPRTDDGRSLCHVDTTVGAPVLAAVRSHFHGARISSVFDETLRDIGYGSPGVWYRSIHASHGSTRITVVVRVLRVDDLAAHSSEPARDGATTTLAVQQVTPNLVVRVSATAPTAHLPSFLTLTALADDPRLVG